MTLIDILYGVGIFQGATLLLVLLFLPSQKQEINRLMAVLITVLILALAHTLALRLGYFFNSPSLALMHMPLDFAMGPLLYFYGLRLCNRPLQPMQYWHFLPAALAVLPTLMFINIDQQQQALILKFLWFREVSLDEISLEGLALPAAWQFYMGHAMQGTLYVLQLGVYCLLLHRLIAQNRDRLQTQYSSIEEKDLNWLAKLNMAIIAYLTIFIIFNRIPRIFLSPEGPAQINLHLGIVVIIQIIALVSLWQPHLIHGRRVTPQDGPKQASKPTEQTTPATEDKPALKAKVAPNKTEEKEKYKRSGLSLELAQAYRMQVMTAMQDQQLFLDCELTLNDLAEKTNIPAHQLSEVLNGQLNQNFYSFVNDYRVQYAKVLLSQEQTRAMAVIDVAFEAGFRSKSSFYDAFKKATHMTPTQYKKQHSQ